MYSLTLEKLNNVRDEFILIKFIFFFILSLMKGLLIDKKSIVYFLWLSPLINLDNDKSAPPVPEYG